MWYNILYTVAAYIYEGNASRTLSRDDIFIIFLIPLTLLNILYYVEQMSGNTGVLLMNQGTETLRFFQIF